MKNKSVPIGKATPKLRINQTQEPPIAPQARMHRRLWLATKAIFGFVVVSFGIVASIYGMWGPPWPTEPVFSPGPPSFGAAFDVPFRVENKSAFFWLSGLKLMCKVEGDIPDQPSVTGIVFGPNFVTASGKNVIGPSTSVPYICPLRSAFRLGNRDAAEIIRHSRVTFLSEYESRFLAGRVKTEDGPFTLVETTIPPHWERGAPLK